MGTGSSLCYSDTDIPEYSPAYLGQIYAGVILNSAKSSSTGYASTLSLNSLYASTLSLNSLCDTKKVSSRRSSGAGKLARITTYSSFGSAVNAAAAGVVKVFHGPEKRKLDIPLIDEEKEEDKEEEDVPPLAEPESFQLSSLESVKDDNQALESVEEKGRLRVPPLCTNTSISEQ